MKDGEVENGTGPRKIGGSNPGSNGGERSVDAWERAKPKGKWMKANENNRVLDAMTKEKYVVKERQRKRKKRSRSVRNA